MQSAIAPSASSSPAETRSAGKPELKIEGGPFHIPSLDGIRALSILIVFLAHAGLERFVPGYFGLGLFFFLSGFLITTLLRVEFEKTRTIGLKQFYLRRVLRIFPAFYLVLAVSSGFTLLGWTGGSLTVDGVLAQVLHFTNYRIVSHGWWEGIAPGTAVYWSLAVEEHFYLVFPLLYLVLSRRLPDRNRQAAVLLAICVAVLLWRCVLVFALGASKERTYIASDTRIDSILAGCILAIWKNPVLDHGAIDRRRLVTTWLPLGALAVLASLLIWIPAFEQTARYTLQCFGILPFFIAAVIWHDVWPFRLLNTRPLRLIGVLSYSIYLMHTTVLWMLERHAPWSLFVRGVTAFGVVVLLALLIQRYIEAPLARVRRALSRVASAPAAQR